MRNVKWYSHFRDTQEAAPKLNQFQRTRQFFSEADTREKWKYFHKQTCKYMFIAALFIIEKVEIAQMSLDWRMAKKWHICIMEYYLAILGNAVLIHEHRARKHYAQWQKPVMEGQLFYDSIYTKFPEVGKSREKGRLVVVWSWRKWGMGSGCWWGCSFFGEGWKCSKNCVEGGCTVLWIQQKITELCPLWGEHMCVVRCSWHCEKPLLPLRPKAVDAKFWPPGWRGSCQSSLSIMNSPVSVTGERSAGWHLPPCEHPVHPHQCPLTVTTSYLLHTGGKWWLSKWWFSMVVFLHLLSSNFL